MGFYPRLQFQFQYGTIERLIVLYILALIAHFNSSMVRLRELSHITSSSLRTYFNSSMVRLRVSSNILRSSVSIISIPVWYDWESLITWEYVLNLWFQFQYGTIESICIFTILYTIWHFNSSMVRLRVSNQKLLRLTRLDFNSSMVRLRDFPNL